MRVMRALMGYVGEALLAVLMQDSLPAFNLHAIHGLANDVGHLMQLCMRGLPDLPNLEVRTGLWSSTLLGRAAMSCAHLAAGYRG